MTSETPEYISDLLERHEKGERDFLGWDFESHENLQNLILDGLNLESTLFFSADFTGTSFQDCNLKNCGFKCCKFETVENT